MENIRSDPVIQVLDTFIQNDPPKKDEDDNDTIGPGLDAPELVQELGLGGALQLLYQASAVRRNLKFVLI